MKIIINIVIGLCLLFTSGCNTGSDIVIDDFESGTFDKWTVEGDAFGKTPFQGAYAGQQEITGFEGKYLANSFNGGDDSRGSLTSVEFKIERDFINFLLGGGMNPDIYIELAVGENSLYITRPVVDSETLHWMTWNVKEHKGKNAVIRIVDNQRGKWGHILVDQIEMSDKEKSDILPGYELVFDVDKKFLLIPVEDKGPESRIYLREDGKNIGEELFIRVAQTKIDYWVPIPLDEYKGKRLTLFFHHVKKNDIGYSQIKQSDDFFFDYNEKYRPHYHFSPRYGWTNDPNGMVYHNGEYHLYYQHNPYGSTWGNMHWGHTVSKDLLKWEHLPDAIFPDSLGTIFSGSAVIDKGNTTGFGKDALVAIYTSAGKIQTQSIAHSSDNGRTFIKYDGNPVLSDLKYPDFRDPKVFWHSQSGKWIMSLATTQTITFYGSKDLKQWERLSEFGEGIGNHKGVWECPDLFPLSYNGQTKWVLLVSINPGGPNGGSATQYFIGNFDGKTFRPDDLPYPLWIDYGRDNYAGVTWDNVPDGRRIFIGWMSNWDYANQVPTLNFRNAMTIPRELGLSSNGEHIVLTSVPIRESLNLRADTKDIADMVVDKAYTVDKFLDNGNGAYEIEMVIIPGEASSFGFKLMNRTGEELKFVFDVSNKELSVDRSKSGLTGFSEQFAPKPIISPLAKDTSYKIRLMIDKASAELFVNDGELVQTNIVFPEEPYNSLEFSSADNNINVRNLKIHTLK